MFKDRPHGKTTAPADQLPYLRHDTAPAPLGAKGQLVSHGRCKWILGVPGWGTWEMCGHATHSANEPWCPYHLELVYSDKKVVRAKLALLDKGARRAA